MHKDGTIDGPYTKQGFYHMWPRLHEWQDHLADTAARLLRETGVDGIRLDSLGFYFLPCYTPRITTHRLLAITNG
jgi:glycosidase